MVRVRLSKWPQLKIAFCSTEIPQIHCVHFLLRPEIKHVPKKHWFPLVGIVRASTHLYMHCVLNARGGQRLTLGVFLNCSLRVNF